MRRILVLVLVAAAGAGAGALVTAQLKQTKTVTESAPGARTAYAGEVGVLPAPGRPAPRPSLRLPHGSLTVPGHFPLGSVVSFNVPIRNDGSRSLRIGKLDPG